MEPEITPEPSPEERAAILSALAEIGDIDGRPTSKWWRQGLLESLRSDPERWGCPDGLLDSLEGP
jgi:hypothetical protein